MANIKVSELPTATSFNDEDYTMIVQSGENRKISKANMNSNAGQYLFGVMTNDYTFQALNTIETLPIDAVNTYNGNNLSISNNGIKIGAGIHHVLVSAQVYAYTNVQDGELICYFYKNSGNIVTNNTRVLNEYEHIQMPMIPLEVQENDIIYLKAQTQDTLGLIKNYPSGTFLSVVVLD